MNGNLKLVTIGRIQVLRGCLNGLSDLYGYEVKIDYRANYEVLMRCVKSVLS